MAWAGGGAVFYRHWNARRTTKPSWLISFALLAVLAGGAQAFEDDGHNMVAQLMMPFLKDNARAEIERLYGENWVREVVSRAASVQVELDRPKNKYLLPLQQTLFNPDDEAFNADSQCPKNACSVGAILESRQVLMRSNYTDADKRQALLYLMHYMLQLHVPVNCGLVRDEGGRKIYLKDESLQPVNLAWIWNHDLYRRQSKRWFTYAQELYRNIGEMNTAPWTEQIDVEAWAFESFQVAKAEVYPLAAEGRYSAAMIKSGTTTLETQLMKAAVRTAALLNNIYGDEPETAEIN